MNQPTVHVLQWNTYSSGLDPTARHEVTRHVEVFPDAPTLTHYRLQEKITWYTVDVCPVWPSKLTDLGQETVTEEARLRAKYGPNADGVMAMMGSIVDRIEATNDRRTTADMVAVFDADGQVTPVPSFFPETAAEEDANQALDEYLKGDPNA